MNSQTMKFWSYAFGLVSAIITLTAVFIDDGSIIMEYFSDNDELYHESVLDQTYHSSGQNSDKTTKFDPRSTPVATPEPVVVKTTKHQQAKQPEQDEVLAERLQAAKSTDECLEIAKKNGGLRVDFLFSNCCRHLDESKNEFTQLNCHLKIEKLARANGPRK